MAELTSQMYLDATAFVQMNPSLRGRGSAVHPLRFKMLADTKEIDSSHLTWGVLADLNRTWSDSTAIIYAVPQPGWEYRWNSGTGLFAVTDDNGAVTLHPGVYTLSGLGVSWEIIESSQFGITDTNYFNSSSFLIAAKVIREQSSHREAAIPWANDYLAEGGQHAVFSRLSRLESAVIETDNGYGDQPGLLYIITAYFGDDSLPDILLSQAVDLEATNSYPVTAAAGDRDKPAMRQWREMAGQPHDLVSYLMIALFAQRLLSADSKVLYEPWMLHQIFRWYFSSPRSEANARKIFDLSPNWG